MIDIRKYEASYKSVWDEFVENSKNGTFMLKRDFMEYHADRFDDYSLMFYEEEKLIALLPASKHGAEVRSHGGLTYGGIISSRKMTVSKMLDIFEALKPFLKEQGISKVLYKRVPELYYTYFADEDIYALFRNGAKLVRRDLSTAICLQDKIKFSKGKKWGVSRARQAGIEIKKFDDYELFIAKENDNLREKHGTSAVHSGAELKLLAERFPENIHLYGTFLQDEFLSGALVFTTPTVAHIQYITTTEKGRELFAFDYLGDYLINSSYVDKVYLDFGISTENNGLFLNEGLCQQKETFGGRALVYDFYELEI